VDRDVKSEAHPKQSSDDQTPESSTARSRTDATAPSEVAFTEAGSATVAALLHLLRLMGAELVMMRGNDLAKFEEAVLTKLEQAPCPTTNPNARTAGLVLARHLVDQILSQIRAQAEQRKSLTAATVQPTNESHSRSANESHSRTAHARLLN
jgi:hypothetical protein